MKNEFKVDRLLKKLKVLEGIVKENVLKQNELEWAQAYDKYSIFRPKNRLEQQADEAVETQGKYERVIAKNFVNDDQDSMMDSDRKEFN